MKRYHLYLILGVLVLGAMTVSLAWAATNIDPANRWAWNDVIGWVDLYDTGNVFVSSTKITGYASSSVGYIAFDCATSPSPGCSPSYGVTQNGDGILRGWAWNDNIGWISMNCADVGAGTCSPNYRVTIDAAGNFNGWAWNDLVGWISFNCADSGTCATSNYKVRTTANATPISAQLISSTYDTGTASAFYTLLYQGNQPAGTAVKFQFASSNSSTGPWNFVGPDGQPTTYYTTAGPGVPVAITTVQHNNQRYFRYKVILESDGWQTVSPQVDDIIISWSQ